MGHYLSDMESERQGQARMLKPKRATLRQYDQERARGIVHTFQWHEKMRELRDEIASFDESGP